MVHYGKHIIDPQTGLCEICDRGAIHDLKQGKRSGKQFLYSNQDGKFTYRSNNDDEINNYPHHNETTPRFVRKPLYPEPPPARIRPVVHEEPVVVQKKITRRNHSPYDDDDQYPPPPRPTTFYYVDNTGQMLPRNEGPPSEEPRYHQPIQTHHSPPTRPVRAVNRRTRTPPPLEEPRRHHPVQTHHSSPTRPARVAHRRAQTPPPPTESWRSPPKRQHNSDSDILDRQHRVNPNDYHYDESPRKAEMYYLGRPQHANQLSTISALVPVSHTPSPRILHQEDTPRKQRQLEPIERKHYTEPEPTVVRKVYKKMPPNKYELPEEDHVRPVRKIEKIYPPPPKHYVSSPQVLQKHINSPLSTKYPSTYYLESANGY